MEKLTAEQRAIIETDSRLLTITAYAGTGKTTTLKAFAESRTADRMLYLVFNRSMSLESKKAFRDCPNVEIRTFHSLAYKYYGEDYNRTLGNIRPYDLKKYLDDAKLPTRYEAVSVLFNTLQSYLMSADAEIAETVEKLPDDRKVEALAAGVGLEALVAVTERIWADMRGRSLYMPHNGYLKLLQLNRVHLLYDWILVDEAQDISDCMIDILVQADRKMVLVGDPYQQIYAWNGAVNSLHKIGKLGADRYYLTRSFRCPGGVADMADKYLQALSAPKTFHGVTSPEDHSGVPAAIARTNLGLFDLLYVNRPDKTRFYYNGGFQSYEYDMLLDIYRLSAGQNDKVRNPFIARFESIAEFNDYAANASDGSLKAKMKIVEKYGDELPGVYAALVKNEAKRPKEADMIVTTAHKVKGQEFSTVVVNNDFLDIHDLIKRATLGKRRSPVKASAEELHLIYVALTRSRNRLEHPGYMTVTGNDIRLFRELADNGDIELV
jgi:superfamily I DNA/RNA helicase